MVLKSPILIGTLLCFGVASSGLAYGQEAEAPPEESKEEEVKPEKPKDVKAEEAAPEKKLSKETKKKIKEKAEAAFEELDAEAAKTEKAEPMPEEPPPVATPSAEPTKAVETVSEATTMTSSEMTTKIETSAEPAENKKATKWDPVTGETEAQKAKVFVVNGSFGLRMLAISDEDPANDRSMFYRVGGRYRLFEGGNVFLGMGVLQRFVVEEDESPLFFQDMSLGFSYRHSVSLAPIGWEKDVSFSHRGTLYLPTSRSSQVQDLYLAPEAASRARVEVIDRLGVGLNANFRYLFHEYAERAGLRGGMNTQLVMGTGLSVDYTPLRSERFGSATVGANIHTSWRKKYPSRPQTPILTELTGQVEGESSSNEHWSQYWGWSLFANYTPLPYASLGISLQQGSRYNRAGIESIIVGHRDETSLMFSVTGTYF